MGAPTRTEAGVVYRATNTKNNSNTNNSTTETTDAEFSVEYSAAMNRVSLCFMC